MISPSVPHRAHTVGNERLLLPALAALSASAAVAFIMLHAMQQAAAFDLTGRVESLLPLARLGVVSSPLIVALRAVTATTIAWLVAGALNAPLTFKTVAIAVVTSMPVLEVPALIDAISMMRHPNAPFADLHIPLGLDAIITPHNQRMRTFAQAVNLALIVFTALIARHLTKKRAVTVTRAATVALAAAGALAALPLLRD